MIYTHDRPITIGKVQLMKVKGYAHEIAFIISLLLTTCLISKCEAEDPGVEAEAVAGEFLISFKKGALNLTALLEENQLEIVRRIDQIDVYLVKAKGDVRTLGGLEHLENREGVNFIEPNYLVFSASQTLIPVSGAPEPTGAERVGAAMTPDDPYWASDGYTGFGQWNMRVIQADKAWDLTVGKKDITVAVVDSGIFKDHRDLRNNYIPGGYDWVNDDDDPSDDNGHGTWVAGIIGAEINNDYGVAGIAQVSLIAEKVLGSRATGSTSDLISGIVHAADMGADIINLSLGTDSYSSALEQAINYAHEKGCVLVAAAGNRGSRVPHYPAAFSNVIAVASTYGEPDDVRAPYSNYGTWITLSAPGGWDANQNGLPELGEFWVLSTFNHPDEFALGTGTSASTPHVSGLAALFKSVCPTATNEEIEEALKRTCDDKGSPGWDEMYGHGRINAYRLLSTSMVPSVGGRAEIILTEKSPQGVTFLGAIVVIQFALFILFIKKRQSKYCLIKLIER